MAPQPPPLQTASGTVLTVGSGMEFGTLADAVKAAASGDTIAVQAGTYTNDFVTVTTNLRIVAVGGIVNEVATVPPPNDKGIFTVDANLAIQGFTFTGGSDGSPDGNVSGIRLETGNLAVSHCYFHDMQEGLLANPDTTAFVTIDHSEFANNGTGDGYTHNLYVGDVGSLTITNSYFHGANVGHEIKSRAAVTTITNNVIADGQTGTASYDIDLPNAGVATISNNTIEKGPDAANSYAIHYGGETQIAFSKNALSVTGNTILNDLGPNGVAVLNQSAVNGLSVVAQLRNDSLYNFAPSNVALGAVNAVNNTTLTTEPAYSTASPWQSAPVLALATGPEVLTLTNGAHTVSGSNVRLVVEDQGGGNTIAGGAGGLNVAATAGWDQITTQQNATDTIVLGGRNSTVFSAGADHITAGGYYQAITATGAASITGSGFDVYNLNGTGERLSLTGGGVLDVGANGGVAATISGNDVVASVSGGGRLAINVAAGLQSAAATVSGGASGQILHYGCIELTTSDAGANVTAGSGIVSIIGGAGNDTLSAGSGTAVFALGSGTDHVTFGTGTAAVTAGSGVDSFAFQSGQAGNDTISAFQPGVDLLRFNGFNGDPIAADTVTSGSTVLTLTDGTNITFANVDLPAPSFTNGKIVFPGAIMGNASLAGGIAVSLTFDHATHAEAPAHQPASYTPSQAAQNSFATDWVPNQTAGHIALVAGNHFT